MITTLRSRISRTLFRSAYADVDVWTAQYHRASNAHDRAFCKRHLVATRLRILF